jgi:uncharacterized protein
MENTSSTHAVVLSTSPTRQFIQRHALVCYFVMAYVLSWLAWLPYILSQSGLGIIPISLSQLALVPGIYLGPTLSSFVMTAITEGKVGVQDLLRRYIRWRVGLQWYLFVLAGIPLLIVLGFFVVPGAFRVVQFPLAQILQLYPMFLLLEIFTSGLGEETGWRGFALPRLQQRYGALWGTLILGVLWACWHLPLFLTAWGNGGGVKNIADFIVMTVATAVIITWVFNHTRGSLLMTILAHASVDTCASTLVAAGVFQLPWMVQHDLEGPLIGFGVCAIVLLIVTRGRLGLRQPSA